MYNDKIISKFRDSKFFNQIQLPDDYIAFAYIANERLIFSESDSREYNIVIVTGHTLDLHPGKMLITHPKDHYEIDIVINWIYIPYNIFTNNKLYFKYNYTNQLRFNDLFLYSIQFVNDSKLIFVNNQYIDKLNSFYSLKTPVRIKQFIKFAYQYNEEFITSLSTESNKKDLKYLFHFLTMSYIMNNELLTSSVMTKISEVNNKIKKNEKLDDADSKYIMTRLNLLKSLCK